MTLQDFGTVAAAPRRRRRLPSWVRGKAPSVGGRWVRLGRRKYYAARRDTRPTLPAGMYTLERDHDGDILFERRDLEADALVRFPGSAADHLLPDPQSRLLTDIGGDKLFERGESPVPGSIRVR